MSNNVEVKKLEKIILLYDDGSAIAVPETKTLKIGTAFVKAIGDEQFTWEVIDTGKSSLTKKIKKFFEI